MLSVSLQQIRTAAIVWIELAVDSISKLIS